MKNMKKTFATLMATGLAFGSLTGFAFAAEQPDSSSKKTANNFATTAKLGSLEDYVNGLSQLTKEEKSKLIAAYKNNTLNSEQDLLKKAGIAAAQPATQASSENGDSEQIKVGTTVEPIDFKDYVNELKELTQAEKKALITAYDNNDFKSVEDLLKKAGIAAAQSAVQSGSVQDQESTEVGNDQGKIGKNLQAVDFAEVVNGLSQLTQAEKSKLIAAYKNNEMDSVQDLLKKAGISPTKGTAAVKPEKANN